MKKLNGFFMWLYLCLESLAYPVIFIAILSLIGGQIPGNQLDMMIYVNALIGVFYLSFGICTLVFLTHMSYLLLIKYTINPEFAVLEHLHDEYFKG